MSEEEKTYLVREGEVLAGKYQVERVLGIGGMGMVVAATHLQLRRRVAVKFALPSMANAAGAAERFLREARAVAQLSSEHVARVLDLGTLESGAPFLVMEFLEGHDLATVLKKEGALPLDVAIDYVLQACEAIAEAHAVGIIHRDLKPQNLFLTHRPGGRALVKVLDFGISKCSLGAHEAALTRTGDIIGTPLYMAPELMRSARDVDQRVDVWALGVILYELITARPPFECDSMPALCLAVVQESPRPMSEVRPGLPPGLASVVSRCLEKDPARRFANAADLAAALAPYAPLSWTRDRALAAPPLTMEPPPPPPPPRPSAPTHTPWSATPSAPVRRRTSAIVAVAMGWALAVAGLAIIGWLVFRAARLHAPASPLPSSTGVTAVELPYLVDAAPTTTATLEPEKDAGDLAALFDAGPPPESPRVAVPHTHAPHAGPTPPAKRNDDDIPSFRR